MHIWKTPRRNGAFNHKPLTIKPYPMKTLKYLNAINVYFFCSLFFRTWLFELI
jgi:hypothetical protein